MSSDHPRASALHRLADAIGSVRFGVTILVLILVYSWIGSAGLQPLVNWFPRQNFELTEMEWFSWWPFHLLTALLALSLVLVTLRKIRFSLPNLGVWTVHTGVIVLLVGCVLYFGTKVEGDVAVYRRQVVLQAPGGAPVELPLQPQVSVEVPGEPVRYRVRVVDLRHDYELLTGEHRGERTYAAQLFVQPEGPDGAGEPFVRQLLDGYPQYTEDVLPGQGRAVQVTGQPLVDEALRAEMSYHAPRRIHLHHRPALHVRATGDPGRFAELPLRGLPRYREYMDHTERVFIAPGEPPLRARPLDLRPRWKGEPEIAGAYDVRVTGFAPYARLREEWVAGRGGFNPLARVVVRAEDAAREQVLLARDPERRALPLGEDRVLAFRWAADAGERARLHSPEPVHLLVGGPAAEEPVAIPLGEALAGEVAVPGRDLHVRVARLFPRWSVAAGSDQLAMALVEVRTPEHSFVRAVMYPDATLSRDFDHEGQVVAQEFDQTLTIALSRAPEPGVTIVGGPDFLDVLEIEPDGRVRASTAEMGRPIRVAGIELTVRELAERSARRQVPYVVPVRERNLKAGESYSLVQVELRRGEDAERTWLEYSHYSHPSAAGFHPRRLQVGDGPPIEVVYSRETHELPAAVALERFILETYPGGERERDYISLVRFRERDGWSGIREVRSNQPTEEDGWWYFQSTWDPPDPQRGHAGLHYTGLGVGNRNGVLTMLLGSLMTVAGTIWAFYVKPLILRRRRRARAGVPVPAGLPVPQPGVAAPSAAAVARSEGRS